MSVQLGTYQDLWFKISFEYQRCRKYARQKLQIMQYSKIRSKNQLRRLWGMVSKFCHSWFQLIICENVIYKKVRATEAKNLKSFRATPLVGHLRDFFIFIYVGSPTYIVLKTGSFCSQVPTVAEIWCVKVVRYVLFSG